MNKMLLNGLIIISMFVFHGCSDDDDTTTASNSCATYYTTVTESMAGQEDCTQTQAECEEGTTALQNWCADGCESADVAEADSMCSEEFAAFTASEITALCQLSISSCSDDTQTEAPTSYTFESRFIEGQSSVSYSGQTVRNMLISAIKSTISSGGTTAAALTSLFNNDDATATYDGSVVFHDVSTKSVSGKISSDNVVGYDVTPTELITTWFQAAETSGTKWTDNGVSIDQMVGKSLLGMVSYYQATSVYFNKVLELGEDNTNAADDGTAAYTDMEHHFDEAFGYFGAAIGYQGMLTSERQSSGSATTAAEYTTNVNFDWAKYAAKRADVTGCSQSTNLDDALIEAFTMGRHLIATQADMSDIEAQIDIILEKWEHLVVANIIHYAADVKGYMVEGGEDYNCSTNETCAKYWSEMAPFAISLQFNDDSMLTTSEFTELQSVIGMAPPTTSTADDIATFDTVITWLIDKYMLDADCANW